MNTFRYRMPAEWEPHHATWLSWAHNPTTWPGKIERVYPVYAQMVAALARSETVHINVKDAAMEAHARHWLHHANAHGDIRFHQIPTNDAWCRDHGAMVVHAITNKTTPDDTQQHHVVALNWEYNAWGGKYPPYDDDNRVAQHMAQALGIECIAPGMVLEGGSIDVNGTGMLLTTESCLLNPNRNPHLSRTDIEQQLRHWFGVDMIVWLGDGIVGDDTDGHVDDITRFVAPDTIVTAVETDPSDANYAPLQENLARLQRIQQQANAPLHIVPIPMPPAVYYEGERLPASYANFYIANHIVLVPLYRAATDDVACQILQRCFPTRHIVGIDCTDVIWGLGAFHCLTQQIPLIY